MIIDNKYVKYQQLKELLIVKKIDVELVLGSRILWKGQIHTVISAKNDTLIVTDEWIGYRKEEDFIQIEDWKNDSHCSYIPPIEELLEWIFLVSGNYPSMTAGICHSKSAWQVKLPGQDTFISDDLDEALLDLIITLLSPKEENGNNLTITETPG